MSGHSKWHNIQKTKGAADAKRSQIFTKIAREMIVAVKEGGSGDPNNNSRLATVIAKAKAANMPNDNIKRTIDKALGAGSADNYEQVVYEGYGPCGVAVIVEALTNNRNRTAPEMRHLFDKYGGNMGATGCVSWSFDKKGVIVIDNEEGELDEEVVMMDALDCGAADFEADESIFEITTDPDDFNAVVKAMEEKGYVFVSASIDMVPQNYIKLTDEDDIKNITKMIDLMEDNEEGELDEETVMMDALDCGAADFEADGGIFEITTDPDDFNAVVKALEEKGYVFASAGIEMVPQNYIKLTNEDDIKNMTKMIDLMEDNEDVQNVYHNWEQE